MRAFVIGSVNVPELSPKSACQRPCVLYTSIQRISTSNGEYIAYSVSLKTAKPTRTGWAGEKEPLGPSSADLHLKIEIKGLRLESKA